MAELVQLTVPDIGDFHDVPVIEVLVNAGDRIDKDAPLVTLESEKAAMEVPASSAGIAARYSARGSSLPRVGSGMASSAEAALDWASCSATIAPGPAPPAPGDSAASVSAPQPVQWLVDVFKGAMKESHEVPSR